MRSHYIQLTVPLKRFNAVKTKLPLHGMHSRQRGCMVDCNIDIGDHDLSMQQSMKLIKLLRGGGRHGCLDRTNLIFKDESGEVVGTQLTLF